MYINKIVVDLSLKARFIIPYRYFVYKYSGRLNKGREYWNLLYQISVLEFRLAEGAGLAVVEGPVETGPAVSVPARRGHRLPQHSKI